MLTLILTQTVTRNLTLILNLILKFKFGGDWMDIHQILCTVNELYKSTH